MKDYDEKKESSLLIYTDYNNLYGKATCRKLPVKDFKWVDDISKIDDDFIKNYNDDDNTGYFIETDIKYPKELHIKHSDLPFLPERKEVNECIKLIYNLYDKRNYVDQISSLKQALNHGLKIKKIHKVLSFYQ